jgi:hypothetical protein
MLVAYGIMGAVLLACILGVVVFSIITTLYVPETFFISKNIDGSYTVNEGGNSRVIHTNLNIQIPPGVCWEIDLQISKLQIDGGPTSAAHCQATNYVSISSAPPTPDFSFYASKNLNGTYTIVSGNKTAVAHSDFNIAVNPGDCYKVDITIGLLQVSATPAPASDCRLPH